MLVHPTSPIKHSARKGFTLVELLVVIAILAILMSILLPALSSVLFSSQKKICQVEIAQISQGLTSYEQDFHFYPPSTVKELGLKDENNINSGNEALVLCLSSKSRNSNYFEFTDNKLQNGDGDTSPIPLQKLTGSNFLTNELLEITDPWGSPYIYFHSRNLNATTKQVYKFGGKEIVATPYGEKSKTGLFLGAGKYQILSLGGDQKLHTKDDVRSE